MMQTPVLIKWLFHNHETGKRFGLYSHEGRIMVLHDFDRP